MSEESTDWHRINLLRWDEVEDRVARFESGSLWTRRKGVVRLADGTEHKALLDFCESDSNEHYGTRLLVADPEGFEDGEDSFVNLDERPMEGFLKKLGKTEEQIWPYKYKYEGPPCRDHHIGDDGWSL